MKTEAKKTEVKNQKDAGHTVKMESKGQDPYGYWLASILAIPGRKKIQLKAMFPQTEELYRLKPSQIPNIPFLTDLQKKSLQESQKISEQELAQQLGYCQEKNIALVLFEDLDYPQKLRDIYNPPYGLFCRGSLPSPSQPSIAIVGARSCSPYGKAVAESVAFHLAQAGMAIISGMATGIDGCSHQGALRAGGYTYGILGCGADVCYPASHHQLYESLIAKGGVISEYPPHTQPIPMLFPQRNRLISAMSDVILVVEAREKSGSLITADFALEQGKEVYAVPGRVSDALSSGANRLIRQGAGIFLSIEDFQKEMSIFTEKCKPSYKNEKISLEKSEQLVYSCLGFNPKNLDELMEETAFSLEALLLHLASLQEKGCISEIYKNYFVRTEI